MSRPGRPTSVASRSDRPPTGSSTARLSRPRAFDGSGTVFRLVGVGLRHADHRPRRRRSRRRLGADLRPGCDGQRRRRRRGRRSRRRRRRQPHGAGGRHSTRAGSSSATSPRGRPTRSSRRAGAREPGLDPAHVLLRFRPTTGAIDPFAAHCRRCRATPSTSRQLDGLATATFSAIVESDSSLTVDRTMTWGAIGYGSHAETGVASPSPTWYFAEGSTSGDFALFYLLQNPQPGAVLTTVRYPPPVRSAADRAAVRAAAREPDTLVVDEVDPALASTDVSAVVTRRRRSSPSGRCT